MEEPPGFPARPTFAEVSESLALTDGRDCEMVFGLWRVCFPPILIRTDRRLMHVWIMNHWTFTPAADPRDCMRRHTTGRCAARSLATS